jgi:hypothetical protein
MPSATYFSIRQDRWPLAHTPTDSNNKNNRTSSLHRLAVTEPHLSTTFTARDWSVKPSGSTVPRFSGIHVARWHFSPKIYPGKRPRLDTSRAQREPRPLVRHLPFEFPLAASPAIQRHPAIGKRYLCQQKAPNDSLHTPHPSPILMIHSSPSSFTRSQLPMRAQ